MPNPRPKIPCRKNPEQNIPRSPAPTREIEHAVMGANQVHDALCAPPVQRIGQFEIANAVIPARYVSGDFVLSFEEKGTHYLVLGDLMGKGLSAAMWLTHVIDLIRRACEQEDNLAAVMECLNYKMHRSRVGVPLTSLFLVRLDPVAGKITYSCGGCPAGFLLCSNGDVTMLNHGGPVLGALEFASYHAETIDIAPGQVMLAVSDGITEIHHGVNFELRPDRVVHHLQYSAGDSAESIVRSLAIRVRNSSPALIDDLSVMAIQHVA
jgi:serine phosphatase RsbU (regulator of sigma subunit)